MRSHIGHYRIEEKIDGDGAMGVVYKAFDERLKRYAAVKTLLPQQLTDAAMRRRLTQEARAQARLESHGNVVSVYGLIEEGPDLFIAMEWVEGGTLKQYLQARAQPAMPVAEAMEIFKQILNALAFVHSKGVIHRDVKPSNVMISGGRVKLMDFGIALIAGMARQTMTLIGTPPYMSPEQFDGSARIDHRTDIYSAAIVLFEMLSGRRPFQEKGWIAAIQERLLPPPDLKSLVPELPEGVCGAVAIALQRDPDHRFASIADFGNALVEGLLGFLPSVSDPQERIVTLRVEPQPVPIVEPEPPPVVPENRPSHTTLVWTVSLTVVFLCIVASIVLLLKHSAPPVRTVLRTKTVFVRPPAVPPSTPVITSATVPATVTQPEEKTFPFKNEQPVASNDNAEVQRLEVDRLREDIGAAFRRAEDLLSAENLDAVQAELETVAEKVRRYPNDLWQEADEVRRMTNRLNDARVAAKTREAEAAMWQKQLTQVEQLIAIGHFPEAEERAKGLIADPQAPQPVVGRARELLQEAKDRFSELLKGAHTGETKNTIRKPSSPPRN